MTEVKENGMDVGGVVKMYVQSTVLTHSPPAGSNAWFVCQLA